MKTPKYDYDGVMKLKASGMTIKAACEKLKVNTKAFHSWRYKGAGTHYGTPRAHIDRPRTTARPYRRKPSVETIAVPESTDKLIALIGSHKAVMEAVRSFQ